jgi:hypothetical protein
VQLPQPEPGARALCHCATANGIMVDSTVPPSLTPFHGHPRWWFLEPGRKRGKLQIDQQLLVQSFEPPRTPSVEHGAFTTVAVRFGATTAMGRSRSCYSTSPAGQVRSQPRRPQETEKGFLARPSHAFTPATRRAPPRAACASFGLLCVAASRGAAGSGLGLVAAGRPAPLHGRRCAPGA